MRDLFGRFTSTNPVKRQTRLTLRAKRLRRLLRLRLEANKLNLQSRTSKIEKRTKPPEGKGDRHPSVPLSIPLARITPPPIDYSANKEYVNNSSPNNHESELFYKEAVDLCLRDFLKNEEVPAINHDNFAIGFVDVDDIPTSPLFTESHYRIPVKEQQSLDPSNLPDLLQEDYTFRNFPLAWTSYPLSIATSPLPTELPEDRELDLEVETILRNPYHPSYQRDTFPLITNPICSRYSHLNK